jgi:4-hydroxybenzoate polyprenyltransferase
MEITKKRRLSEIALGFFLLSHPGPVLLHIIAVTLFALLAAWPHFAWGIIALVVAAHAAMQLSIAMLNDYCDRQPDAVSKPGKPIPRGLIRPGEALFSGLLLIVVMVLLLLPLHRLALLISLCYLALGQGYNLGLKSTPLSGIVFALAMPLIPLYAFAGVGRTLPFLFWLVPVGCLLGVALNLANSLPDIPGDAARGARTLAVALGMKGSFIACPLLIVLSALLIAVLALTQAVPVQPLIITLALILTCLSVAAMIILFGPAKPLRTRKVYFYLVVLTCIVLAGGWLGGAIA